MKSKYVKEYSVIITVVALSCFMIGLSTSYIKEPVRYIIAATIGLIAFIANCVHAYFMNKEKDKRYDAMKDVFGRTLTIKEGESYRLNTEDIYEAVEKLGFFEHECEVNPDAFL